MGRARKTDHGDVVAAALNLFWQQGYADSSTREIEQRTGLTRFTLQTAYGGKEKFFLEVLDAYLDAAEAKHFPDARTFTIDDLANWFEKLASYERMPAISDSGCLILNSIGQFDRTDHKINQRIERYMSVLKQRFTEILRRSESIGAVRLAQPTEPTANLLMTMLLGIHVVMKARTSDGAARSHAKAAADIIRSWKV